MEALKAAQKQYEQAELQARQAKGEEDDDAPPTGANGGLTKAQKKKMRKKQKKAFEKAKEEGGAANIHEVGHALIPEEEKIKIPPPPVRQKLRFDSLTLDNLECVLSDFGNGCWVHKHFTSEIQVGAMSGGFGGNGGWEKI